MYKFGLENLCQYHTRLLFLKKPQHNIDNRSSQIYLNKIILRSQTMEKASLYLNTLSTTELRKKKFLFRIQKHSQLKYFRKKYLNRDVKRDYLEKHGITSRHASGVGKLEGLPTFLRRTMRCYHRN